MDPIDLHDDEYNEKLNCITQNDPYETKPSTDDIKTVKKRRGRKKKEVMEKEIIETQEKVTATVHEDDGEQAELNCIPGDDPLETKPSDAEVVKTVKKRRGRKKKEEITENQEKVISAVIPPGCCKKNDGKGWHCMRPANPEHTLCDHHLSQLRSYGTKEHSRERRKIIRGNAKVGMIKEEAEEKKETYHESDVAIAGDDDIDDDDDDNDEEEDNKVAGSRVVLKKRGRKPIKARSLKSFL